MEGWPDGVDRLAYAEVDSTNAEGRRLAESIANPTWLVAETQTRGRGRLSRHWASPKGNLHATLILPFRMEIRAAALMSMVASLALRDSLEHFVGDGHGLTLKWPNDVLLDKGKVAGILLETGGRSTAPRLLVGMGVNLGSLPELRGRDPAAPRPVSVEGTAGIKVEPVEMLTVLAGKFKHRDQQFHETGFEPIRSEWLRHAAGVGKRARFSMGSRELTGTFETVDVDGCAIVNSGGVRQRVPSADLRFE